MTHPSIQDPEEEIVQRYDDVSGDALIENGGWWCEHEDDTGETVPARRMEDHTHRTVTCPDCGTGWVAWTNQRGQRVAKAVVVRG